MSKRKYEIFFHKVEEVVSGFVVAPDYYKEITTPMWLKKMAAKNKREEYGSEAEFMHDVGLVVQNCHTYNESRNAHLLPVVDEMKADVLAILDKVRVVVVTLSCAFSCALLTPPSTGRS